MPTELETAKTQPAPVQSKPAQSNKGVTVASIVAHTVIDALAICAITLLMVVGKVSIELGVSLIALIAGVWAKMQSGSAKSPPNGGLVIGLATLGTDLIKMLNGKG
jgi:hypothetical protein